MNNDRNEPPTLDYSRSPAGVEPHFPVQMLCILWYVLFLPSLAFVWLWTPDTQIAGGSLLFWFGVGLSPVSLGLLVAAIMVGRLQEITAAAFACGLSGLWVVGFMRALTYL